MMIKDCQQVGIGKDGDDYGDLSDNDVTIKCDELYLVIMLDC